MDSLITVFIPTSPIPSHPSTAILVKTVTSIRYHLPNAPIIIAFDGVRDEQKKMRDKYLGYIRNIADDPLFFQPNMKLVPYVDHEHQVGLLRKTLLKGQIHTPLILFQEHDCPLVTDYELPINHITQAIQEGLVNSVRFLHESHILPDYYHLVHGRVEGTHVDLNLTKTTQFSARPHIASVEFYNKLLSRFSPEANCFIEDRAHSFCQTDPWEEWKLSLYTPEGNQKRSYHTDGRNGGDKYDGKQVF